MQLLLLDLFFIFELGLDPSTHGLSVCILAPSSCVWQVFFRVLGSDSFLNANSECVSTFCGIFESFGESCGSSWTDMNYDFNST